jgi:DNA-directed RNA polymerase
MRRRAELFKELGLGDRALRKQDLQLWMWQWHQLLQERLDEDIQLVIKQEASQSHLVRVSRSHSSSLHRPY